MPVPYVVRKAEKSDYEAVKELEHLEFRSHRNARPDYFKSVEQSYPPEEFQELLELPMPIAWVAEREGRVVGLCFGRISHTKENTVCKSRKVAFVEDLVTLPEFQGQGIGSALLARAREQAVAEGAEALELCVWDFNADALELYRRKGMQIQYYRLEEQL